MPEISSGDLALLRGENHRTNFYLTPCPATALWSARLNGALDRGATAVTFDGGSGANFAAIGAYQELWIGSAAGKNDVGRIRIRSISSGDSGVSGTVTIAANSIVITDNDYLTFIGWYILKPIRPLIGGDGTFYKDTSITYSNQNSQPNPICIAGENRAGFIDATAGYFEIESQLPSSYVMASGATISSYAASLVFGAGTPTISINAGSGVGTIQFDTAGHYWIKWTVTDSNGKSQDSYRWYYAHSTAANNAHYPIVDFSINNLSGDYDNGGWSCGIQLHGDASLADIPDYAPCILWSENWYGSTKKNITYLPDESGTILNGYVRRDQFNSDLDTGVHTASFEFTTIQGVAENKFNYSVSLEAAQTVDTWWKYPSWLTPTRAVHHYFKWHTTLLEIADVIGLDQNTDSDVYVEFPDGDLIGRANLVLKMIRSRLVCDAGGRLHFLEDIQYRPDSERVGFTTVQEITNADKSGEIVFVREQENRTPFVYLSGFVSNGSFDDDGKPIATAVCAIAPGNSPLEDGKSPLSDGKNVFTSQEHINQVAGRVLATENNDLPEVRVYFSGNYLGTLGIHLSEFWELTIASGDTIRQIAETRNLILKNVVGTLSVEQGTVVLIATFEAEATGQTGIATACPEFPDLPGDDFTIPEIDDLAGALVTAASVNYLPPQTKAWTVRTAEATEHLYADPFWTTRQESFASIDAILLRCGVGYIKRSVDGGQNWTTITPSTDPPYSGVGTAPTNTTVTYIQGEGSYITQSEHVFIARWQNDSDEWQSWIAYTDDDGTTWTWQALSGGGIDLEISAMDAETTLNQPYTSSMIQVDPNHIGILLTAAGTSTSTRILIVNTESGTVTDTLDTPQTGASTLHAICRLAENTIAAVWFDSDSFSIDTKVYEIVDGVESSSSTVENLVTISVSAPTAVSIARYSDTVYVVALNHTGSTNKGVLYACSYNGVDTVTAGLETDFFLLPVAYISMIAAGGGIHLYYKDTNLTRIAGVNLTVSSLVISQGSHLTVSSHLPNQIHATNIQGNKDLIVFSNDDDSDKGYGVVVTLASGSITFADIGIKLKDAAIAACYSDRISDTSAYVAFQAGTTLTYLTVTITGHEITAVSSETAYPSGAAGYPLIFNSTLGLVLVWRNNAATERFEVFSTGPGALKALGASISKGLGDTLYLTAWGDNGELIYQVRAMSDLSLTGAYSLGPCTEAELDAKTNYAMPFAAFGDDAFFYLYGRFTPASVGLSHIIYSADSGATLTVLEAGWGAAHCGSLIDDFGLVFAAWCNGNQTKLYTGLWDSVLELKSTLLFSAATNPFSMVYNFYDDSLYAAAARGTSLMVIKANSPFTGWKDITYDHSTAAGVNAIVAL